MYNDFEIQILVNGNKCKQHHHENRIFVEAKSGSEYELEIKNNTWKRVLALSSVDGLSVLTGNSAGDQDPGYIVPAHSPIRIKGFRYSNNEVAAFKFVEKDNSYAKSVGGSEFAQNCGIIGFRIYSEVEETIRVWLKSCCVPDYTEPPVHVGDFTYGTSTAGNPVPQTQTINACFMSDTYSSCCADSPKLSFDMGSGWGKKVESKVHETEFKKGGLIFSTDIYYASRQALLNMGVPINVGNQVSFPQSFPNKYAKPPTGWVG